MTITVIENSSYTLILKETKIENIQQRMVNDCFDDIFYIYSQLNLCKFGANVHGTRY